MKLFDLEKNNRYLKNTYFRISLVCVVILAAIVLSLFMHWEPGGESWIYWFFTRIFLETGRFTLPDRSPLYTLYLSLFQWMGYPVSLIAEHIFTYFMVLGSLVLLFRRYLGLALSTFASLLWLPFLKVAEPSVQAIGLAFSCIAVYIRTSTSKKHKNYLKAASYTFFVLAYFLRGSYIVVLGVFILWDLYLILKKKDIKEIMQSFRPNINYLPFILLIALSILFMSVQSDHRFNNVWGFSSAWQPTDGKSLAETGFIGQSWFYIQAAFQEHHGVSHSFCMAYPSCSAILIGILLSFCPHFYCLAYCKLIDNLWCAQGIKKCVNGIVCDVYCASDRPDCCLLPKRKVHGARDSCACTGSNMAWQDYAKIS